jgi:hypothetical protein
MPLQQQFLPLLLSLYGKYLRINRGEMIVARMADKNECPMPMASSGY